MARVVYIGCEASAAGFRLAGLDARVTSTGDAAASLRQAFSECPDCVLLDGTLAEHLPPAELAQALLAVAPLFAVIPDVLGRGKPPDLAHMVRNALGIG